MTFTVGSLFAGIGGFDLAAEWMGWETRWVSEIDPYASAVLAKHWPDAPNLGDITRIDWSTVEPVDLLCGGFPCQDISNAGKRVGIRGERSGLWSEFARAIRELRPRYVVVENVRALLGRGMDVVLGDLAEIGYDAEWQVLSAADVGAPHRRERVWIVAYPIGYTGLERGPGNAAEGQGRWNADRGAIGADVAYPEGERCGEARGLRCNEQTERPTSSSETVANTENADWRRADETHDTGRWDSEARGRGVNRGGIPNWTVEPNVGRVADGVPARAHRLRCLGNALVPQCAYQIFQQIA